MNNEKINENLKRNGKNGREKRHDFSMKKDNSEIKGIVDDLKKEGSYDQKENIKIKGNYLILFNLLIEKELIFNQQIQIKLLLICQINYLLMKKISIVLIES